VAKNAISDYSTTAASNTDIGGTDIQGTAAVSNFDGALRTLMAHLANADFGVSVSLTSTDAGTDGPNLDLYHNSATPAAVDQVASISFNGNDAGGNKTEYARVRAFITDTTGGSEDGIISFATMKAGTLVETLTLNPNAITFTPASTTSVINTDSDSNALALMGGNTAAQGGQVFVYGDAHATDASDVAIFSAGAAVYRYDASASTHQYTGTVSVGTFSATGATAGTDATGGQFNMSKTGTGANSHLGIYNANGNIGSISSNASTTAFNTSSDERLKQNFATFDSAPIIDAIKIHKYDWKTGGSGVGVKAQELHLVFPDAVTPGKGNPGDKDFVPWGWDASKLVPVLVKEIQDMRKRLAALEA
jgi:hypothetical protein